MTNIVCSKCGLVGSLHKNEKGYFRVAHYRKGRIYWHYVGKVVPNSPVVNDDATKLSVLQKTLLKIISEGPIDSRKILTHPQIDKTKFNYKDTIRNSLRKLEKRGLIQRHGYQVKELSLTDKGRQAVQIYTIISLPKKCVKDLVEKED